MPLIRSILLFIAAGLCEIGGGGANYVFDGEFPPVQLCNGWTPNYHTPS